jgi:hypothetical protein
MKIGTPHEEVVAEIAGQMAPGCSVVQGSWINGPDGRRDISTYQADVSGLLLVDALSEGLQDAEMPEQWVVQRSLIEGDIRKSLVLYPSLERVDPDQASPDSCRPIATTHVAGVWRQRARGSE